MKKKFNRFTWYADFASGLEAQCVKAVNKEMNKKILLNQNDLYQMAVILRRLDKDEFKRYIPAIKEAFNEAKLDFVETAKGLRHRGTAFLEMSPTMQWMVVIGCEFVGNHADQFKLCRNLIDWYGIERARAQHFKEFIPEDNRQRYSEDEYCGTKFNEFTLDNVGLKYYDEQAMESGIANNKWMMDQLIPS